VRFYGDIDSAPEAVERSVSKLAKRHSQLTFCYEAGPMGYGWEWKNPGLLTFAETV
jgi:transposase